MIYAIPSKHNDTHEHLCLFYDYNTPIHKDNALTSVMYTRITISLWSICVKYIVLTNPLRTRRTRSDLYIRYLPMLTPLQTDGHAIKTELLQCKFV